MIQELNRLLLNETFANSIVGSTARQALVYLHQGKDTVLVQYLVNHPPRVQQDGYEQSFWAIFGLPSFTSGLPSQPTNLPAASQPMNAAPSRVRVGTDPMAYLCDQINPKWKGWGEERKQARVKSVLQDPDLCAKIREQAPQLLPHAATLWDLLSNGTPDWAVLIAPLVDWAERRLARDTTTFALADVRKAMDEAVQHVERCVPFEELALFDPTMKQADREAAWPAAASNVISQQELAVWLDEQDMVDQPLSQTEKNLMLKDLMRRLAKELELRRMVLQAAHSKVSAMPAKQRWTVLLPLELPKQLFKPMTAPESRGEWGFTTTQAWTGKVFLRNLNIENAKLEAFMSQFDGEKVELLKQTTASDMAKVLRKEGGASFFEALTVKDELVKQKLIQ